MQLGGEFFVKWQCFRMPQLHPTKVQNWYQAYVEGRGMGVSPAWDVERPPIYHQDDGSLERILTPRLGEFSGWFLAGS